MSVNTFIPSSFLRPTSHVPNSRLPILVYRKALENISPRSILSTIEPNGWIKGGNAMDHPTGIIYLLGVGPNDPKVDEQGRPYGMKSSAQKGGAFVLPARVCHASLEFLNIIMARASGHRFDMNYKSRPPEETSAWAKQSDSVAIRPLDPLFGLDGLLPRLWKQAARSRARL
ncbi:hypothetical protein BDV11DRAFT_212198 [Aspergillus similis]